MKSVIVVGAGLTGLTLTYALEKFGHDVTLIESSERAGGVISSEASADYFLEWGPNSALLTPRLQTLIGELSLSSKLIFPAANARKRFLGRKSSTEVLSLKALPNKLLVLLASDFVSWQAKRQFLAEPFYKGEPADDQDVRAFLTARFGSEITASLASAGLNGIWAGDISKLSARSVLPRFWKSHSENSSVLLGLIKNGFAEKRPSMFSFERGLETLPKALLTSLKKSKVIFGSAADRLEITKDWARIHGGGDLKSADICCITSGAKPSARLLSTSAPALAQKIDSIRYAPLGILHLAFKKKDVRHPLDGFGFLLPAEFPTALLGAVFCSSIFSGRAPADTHLITCLTGGMTKPHYANATQQALQEKVIFELSQFIESRGKPEVLGARYLPAAIPNYEVGHYEIENEIAKFHTRNHRVRICANWVSGISVSARIENALALAEEIHMTGL